MIHVIQFIIFLIYTDYCVDLTVLTNSRALPQKQNHLEYCWLVNTEVNSVALTTNCVELCNFNDSMENKWLDWTEERGWIGSFSRVNITNIRDIKLCYDNKVYVNETIPRVRYYYVMERTKVDSLLRGTIGEEPKDS